MIRLLIAVLIFGAGIAQASTSVTGSVKALKNCQAYQSFRKKTNPGNVRLAVDRVYVVKEVNKYPDSSRYRIFIEDASPKRRWIEKTCVRDQGVVEVSKSVTFKSRAPKPTAAKTSSASPSCSSEPGLADSNTLALSWQPAFCETKPDKKECKVKDVSSYQANNFTLHGLWPNRKSCNRKTGYYGYCGAVTQQPKQFCGYPKLALNEVARAQLEINMPSAAHGTCLQRHEWHKHGTCQTGMDVSQYYQLSVALQTEFNDSGIAQLMAANVGRKVLTRDFFAVFDKAFGQGAHQKLQLKCRGSNLLDLYINLPAELGVTDNLQTLLDRADDNFKNGCGESFRVDPIDD